MATSSYVSSHLSTVNCDSITESALAVSSTTNQMFGEFKSRQEEYFHTLPICPDYLLYKLLYFLNMTRAPHNRVIRSCLVWCLDISIWMCVVLGSSGSGTGNEFNRNIFLVSTYFQCFELVFITFNVSEAAHIWRYILKEFLITCLPSHQLYSLAGMYLLSFAYNSWGTTVVII